MANAIKQVSIERGHDVTHYTLASFGGAGGQHACAVADALGIERVLIHPLAGVLSAYGIGVADRRTIKEQAVEKPLTVALMSELAQALDRLADDGTAAMIADGVAPAQVTASRRVQVKYQGTDAPLAVAFGDAAEIRQRFEEAHRQRFGFVMPDKVLIVEAVSAEIVGASDVEGDATESLVTGKALPVAEIVVFTGGALHRTPLYERAKLRPGESLDGPGADRRRSQCDNHGGAWLACIARCPALVGAGTCGKAA